MKPAFEVTRLKVKPEPKVRPAIHTPDQAQNSHFDMKNNSIPRQQ